VLSKSWGYAVRALVKMAATHDDLKRRWSAEELAEAASLPPSFLAKILQQLTAANLVASSRGRGGGVRLARDPKEIRLSEVVAATEEGDPFSLDSAGLEDATPKLLAELNERWHPYKNAVREFLVETTLADLMEREGF